MTVYEALSLTAQLVIVFLTGLTQIISIIVYLNKKK